MCGITGFLDFTHSSSAHVLDRMTSTVTHRGPDGAGIYFTTTNQTQVGIGHRRLSIIDLSTAANQPLFFDGLYIIFNGEIYNYDEIRSELIRLGHSFTSHSDTEVILHAWREWGEASITKWRGMFAIAMYDERVDELILIRDRPGVKPLHYYWYNDLFLFGSELKSILAHPAFVREIDPAATALYLQYGHVPSPHCIFRHTHKLLPGNILRFKISERGFSTHSYWSVYDYYNKPKLNIPLPDAIEETERILSESFRYRMVSDVPVGVFLSGGYDSTCVTALLQKQQTDKLKTFTIGAIDAKLDEAPFARQIAAQLGTDHTEYYCSTKEALDIIPDLPYYFDEPFADSSAIPTILVSRLAREKVTVALSADAGDEIFAGYNRYDYIRYAKRIQNVPNFLRQGMAGLMGLISSENIPYFKNTINFHSRYGKFRNLLQDPSISELMKNLNQVFTESDTRALMRDTIQFPMTRYSYNLLQPSNYDYLSYMMAIDYETYMLDDILVKVDRATMSTGLEGREPFLDQNIIEWAAQLPSDYKYHKGQKKYILREIVHKYIPKEQMNRPKMGFAIPIENWLVNDLRHLVEDYLSTSALNSHGLFNNQRVQKIKDRYMSGETEQYQKVWHLLMFQMWHERWA